MRPPFSRREVCSKAGLRAPGLPHYGHGQKWVVDRALWVDRITSTDHDPRITTHESRATLIQAFEQKHESRIGEGVHIRDAVSTTRFQDDRALDRPGDRHPRVTGGIAVAVAARPRGAALAHAPNCAGALTQVARQH